MTNTHTPLLNRTASSPPPPPPAQSHEPADSVEVSVREERLQYAAEVLGKSLVVPTVDLYGTLATAQADGQLRGVTEAGEFNTFADSMAKQVEEHGPREAALDAALATFPGADPQNVFRFVETEF